MSKTVSARLSDYDLERIENMKQFYADCWGMKKEEISTTDIISWSIGIAHYVKYENNIDLGKITRENYL